MALNLVKFRHFLDIELQDDYDAKISGGGKNSFYKC